MREPCIREFAGLRIVGHGDRPGCRWWIVRRAAASPRVPRGREAVAQTLGVIDFLCIHDKPTILEGAFSVAESPVRPPEALL